MNPNASNPLKRYPLVSFFLLAYGIAWIPLAYGLVTGKYFLQGFSFFAPAISAIIMTAANEGVTGIRALISKLFLWRANFKWYLVAILAPIVLELLAILTHILLGDTTPSLHFTDWIQMLPSQLPGLAILLIFLVLSSAGEEVGWRGYAMPGLQIRYGSVWASLILGLLWGLWHLPTFWIPGSPQYGVPVPGYILATIGYTFVYTCIFNGTKGSVLLACLYHGASNLTLTYGNAIFPKIISNLYLSLPALAVTVIAVIVLSGPNGLAEKKPLPVKDTG
jgi:uncharacterized protein